MGRVFLREQSQTGCLSSRVTMRNVRLQELPDRICTNQDFNCKINLAEVISQLKHSDVCRFEAVSPISEVSSSNNYIFDKSVDTDFAFSGNDAD